MCAFCRGWGLGCVCVSVCFCKKGRHVCTHEMNYQQDTTSGWLACLNIHTYVLGARHLDAPAGVEGHVLEEDRVDEADVAVGGLCVGI